MTDECSGAFKSKSKYQNDRFTTKLMRIATRRIDFFPLLNQIEIIKAEDIGKSTKSCTIRLRQLLLVMQYVDATRRPLSSQDGDSSQSAKNADGKQNAGSPKSTNANSKSSSSNSIKSRDHRKGDGNRSATGVDHASAATKVNR